MSTPKWLGTSYLHPDDVPEERWPKLMMTRDEYRAMVQERAERDRHAPRVGERAPDFVARRLHPGGGPAEETFRLEETRGRPVGLVFGSYT